MNKLIHPFLLGLTLLTFAGRAYVDSNEIPAPPETQPTAQSSSADSDEIPPPPDTGPAAQSSASELSLGPLEVQAFGNGAVSIGDHQGLVLTVNPIVFTQGWKDHYFDLWGADPRYDGRCKVTDQGGVGVRTNVEVRKKSVHLHIAMTALDPVTVIAAQVRLDLPYAEWSDADYQFPKAQGKIPWKKAPDTLIATGDLDGLSLGPASRHGGLQVRFAGSGLTAILQDNREWQWGSNFSVVLSHGGSGEKPWVWKAGETKDFDLTLSFNRDLAVLPLERPKASRGWTGYWYGRVDGLDRRERICLGIEELKGKHWVYFHDLEGSGVGMNHWIKIVTLEGRTLSFSNGPVQASVTLNEAGDSLVGQGQWDGVDHPLDLKRGLDHLLPRVDGEGRAVTRYSYQRPQVLADGWPVGDLRESSLDPQIVARGIDNILDRRIPNIEGLVVVQKGKVVLDEYFMGDGPGDTHPLLSASKSVLSILFGIAQDHGWVNVNAKLFDYFPEYRAKAWTDPKDKILLKHLLNMTSGIADEWAPGPSPTQGWLSSSDWLDFVLSLPAEYPPGEHWGYCTCCLEPVGAAIARKSGMPIPEFAQKYLFDPLGIHERGWGKIGPHQVTEVGGSLGLKPRDMAKLGQLYLQKGKWNGQQVVSENWVKGSTGPTAAVRNGPGYGYLWWRGDIPYRGGKSGYFYASGMGGQIICVVPELDLVCAITGGNYSLGVMGMGNPSYYFLTAYILGAIRGDR